MHGFKSISDPITRLEIFVSAHGFFEGQGTSSNLFHIEAIFQTKRSLPPHFV